MGNVIGRGIRIEVAKTYGPVKEVTAVSQNSPGVATSNAHNMPNGTVGYFRGVEGMVQLEGQAARVASTATNTFALQGLRTTNFPAFTETAEFVPVTAWATLLEATSYGIGGGEANKLNVTRLLDDIAQEENGLLAAQTVNFGTLAQDVNNEAAQLLEDAAIDQEFVIVRITLKNGAVRVWRGQPSLPGEDVQQGAAGTGSMTMTVKGRIIKAAA